MAASRAIEAVEGKNGYGKYLDTPELLQCLRDQAAAVNGGDLALAEAMLMNQATTLQSLFSRLVERGMCCDHYPGFESNLRMALRARKNWRRTPPSSRPSRTRLLSSPSKRTSPPGRSRSTTVPRSHRARWKTKASKPNYQGKTMSYLRTPEHRALRAELIRQWRPWEKSTGPTTEEGKARSAMRGFKGGWRDQLRELGRLLREQAAALKRIE
jgi:hypothetical protein